MTAAELIELAERVRQMNEYLNGVNAFPGTPFHFGQRPADKPPFWWRRGLDVFDEAAAALRALAATKENSDG